MAGPPYHCALPPKPPAREELVARARPVAGADPGRGVANHPPLQTGGDQQQGEQQDREQRDNGEHQQRHRASNLLVSSTQAVCQEYRRPGGPAQGLLPDRYGSEAGRGGGPGCAIVVPCPGSTCTPTRPSRTAPSTPSRWSSWPPPAA